MAVSGLPRHCIFAHLVVVLSHVSILVVRVLSQLLKRRSSDMCPGRDVEIICQIVAVRCVEKSASALHSVLRFSEGTSCVRFYPYHASLVDGQMHTHWKSRTPSLYSLSLGQLCGCVVGM